MSAVLVVVCRFLLIFLLSRNGYLLDLGEMLDDHILRNERRIAPRIEGAHQTATTTAGCCCGQARLLSVQLDSHGRRHRLRRGRVRCGAETAADAMARIEQGAA